MESFHATTIVCVRRGDKVVIGGDGQVSQGPTILKGNAKKIRRLYQDSILAGFAGATADAFTLFEKFEGKLQKYQGQLMRSAVELAKDWRTDKMLRRLEALLIVADQENTLIITGNGDVIEPEDGVIAIGSGGHYAQSAACALMNNTDLDAMKIAQESLKIAAQICVYTNSQHVFETLENKK